MNKLTLILAASFLATPALAADEFGSRFGDTTPYALNNGVEAAVADASGIDMSDLNDITPAAGDEGVEVEVDATVETDADAEAHGDEGVETETDATVDTDAEVEGDVDADVETEVEVEGEADAEHGHDHSAE